VFSCSARLKSVWPSSSRGLGCDGSRNWFVVPGRGWRRRRAALAKEVSWGLMRMSQSMSSSRMRAEVMFCSTILGYVRKCPVWQETTACHCGRVETYFRRAFICVRHAYKLPLFSPLSDPPGGNTLSLKAVTPSTYSMSSPE
jgi:hypothetical protein